MRANENPAPRGNAGGRANAPLLAEMVAANFASCAFVEYVGPRSLGGVVEAFSFGHSRGAVEGVCAAFGVPITFLTSPTWKHAVGIAPCKFGAKDAPRAESVRSWLDQAASFDRVKDNGRAEAALMAVAGQGGRSLALIADTRR